MEKNKDILKRNNPVQNEMALIYVLEHGRINLKNDAFYKTQLDNIEKNRNGFMTPEFQKEVLKIARDMAQMDTQELYKFIASQNKIRNKNTRER